LDDDSFVVARRVNWVPQWEIADRVVDTLSAFPETRELVRTPPDLHALKKLALAAIEIDYMFSRWSSLFYYGRPHWVFSNAPDAIVAKMLVSENIT
jgi:hypothetical protein